MGIVDTLLGGGRNSKDSGPSPLEISKIRKIGKTLEQQRVIDFFYGTVATSAGGCAGCLGKTVSDGTMSLNEYFKIVNDKVSALDLKNRAIQKIGLDESQISEIPPIPLYSFVFGGDVEYKFINNVAVTNKYSVTWIFFSAEQIYTYTYIFDTMSDNTLEVTNDYFYGDITSFNTERTETEKISTKINYASGCLSNGSTTESSSKTIFADCRFTITVPGDKFSVSMTSSPTVEQSIQAAKAMLREKKYSR